MDSKQLGEWIARLRGMRKLTQDELNRRCDLPPGTIQQWEQGREPRALQIVKLSHGLRLHADTILKVHSETPQFDDFETLPIEDVEFIDLVREAVLVRHRGRIAERVEIEAAHEPEPGEVKG